MLTDMSGMTTSILASIGDRLGLFKDLAANGPATSAELAARTAIDERYAREWLGGMAASGYLEYDPAAGTFTLPPEHAPALADEGGADVLRRRPPDDARDARRLRPGRRPLPDRWRRPPVASTPTTCGPGSSASPSAGSTTSSCRSGCPSCPTVQAKLEAGADVADVGTGRRAGADPPGRCLPDSRATSATTSSSPRSRWPRRTPPRPESATACGSRRATSSHGLPAQYDVITTFDVVHDAVDPRGLLRSIREALRPGGIYVCLDINCSDRLEENVGPLGAFFHGASVMYCMTTSLAERRRGAGHARPAPAQARRTGRRGRVHRRLAGAARGPVQQPLHAAPRRPTEEGEHPMGEILHYAKAPGS